MSMKDLAMYHAISLLGGFYGSEPLESSAFNNYEYQKFTGFTQVKGRRRLSKKKRKLLKTKKQ